MYSALQGMLVLIIFMEIMLFSQAIRSIVRGLCKNKAILGNMY